MNTKKAIQVINTVAIAIIDETINTAFVEAALYGKLDKETFRHVLGKWEGKEGDFFDFYLNSGSDMQRWLLEEFGVEVEPDKYPDFDSQIMAQIIGKKKRSEIYPFETEIVHTFFLFGSNHSLDSLKEVSPSAWQTVQENGIGLYGDYRNWSAFWCKAAQEDKELLLDYIVTAK